MRPTFRALIIGWLCAILVLSPRLIVSAWAEDTSDDASPEEIKTVQNLAQKGYLGDKKEFYLSTRSLTEDDVTDALLKAGDKIFQTELKALKPGDAAYQVPDLQALLSLVKDKAEDIRGRKVSAWKLEKRIEKMIALLSGTTAPVTVVQAAPPASPTQVPLPAPTDTPVPAPGPTKADLDQMKTDLKEMGRKLGDMQDSYEKKLDVAQKTNDELRRSDEQLRASNSDQQEQLKLVKKLMDRVQDDLNKASLRLDEVSKKASEKTMTDTEFQQDLTVMHKDIRDNTQDLSVLKQQIAKLDKTGEEKNQSPLDDLLGSKWVAGGALLVGVTALVVSLTRK